MKKITILFLSIAFIVIFIFPQNFEGYKVLLWDNDAGLTFFNPDNPELKIGYEYNLIKAFEDIGVTEERKNLEIVTKLPIAEELAQFGAVFITAGHRDAGGELFSSDDFQNLSKYMENGGCVYMAGNNVTEYMHGKNPDFLHGYFGMKLYDPGSGQSNYDTIRVDSTFKLMRPYKLVYPAGEEPDYGVDEIKLFDDTNEYTHIVTVYDSKGKVYKSTSGCTTPYLPDKAAPHWKSYLSAVSTGAFAAPHRKGKELQLADSTENQLIRASYMRDIMRIFSMGYFLIINHTGEDINSVSKSFDRLEVDHRAIIVQPGDPLPDYEFLSQFTGVVIFTGGVEYNKIFVSGDTDNLMAYMDYGGNVILSGENIAEAVGYPGEGEYAFLQNYFGVDYLDPKGPGNEHTADPSGIYAGYLDNIKVGIYNSPDVIAPMPTSDRTSAGIGAYYYTGTKSKASYSGVTFSGNTHRSAFYSFPMGYMEQSDLDMLMERTLYKLFNVDMNYMNTMTSQVNVNYYRVGSGVSFNITISNPVTGYIVLNRNSDEMDRVYTNTENTKYKLSSSESSGFFTIDYNVNGSTMSSYVFNIPAEQSDADVYLMDNVLCIETTGDYSSVAVYDIAGNLRMESDMQSGVTMQFREFADFASGIYFIKLRGNSKNTVRRIMKY